MPRKVVGRPHKQDRDSAIDTFGVRLPGVMTRQVYFGGLDTYLDSQKP